LDSIKPVDSMQQGQRNAGFHPGFPIEKNRVLKARLVRRWALGACVDSRRLLNPAAL
jgi:hypothetical protein